MPFTLGGDWIPNENQPKKQSKPIKVRTEKRGNVIVTKILNLSLSPDEKRKLASELKRSLGCGGSIKGDVIEIQGDQVEKVRAYLKKRGLKTQ